MIITTILDKFELANNNKNVTEAIENINIYDSYNEPSITKKIVFSYHDICINDFNSEIDFKVIR